MEGPKMELLSIQWHTVAIKNKDSAIEIHTPPSSPITSENESHHIVTLTILVENQPLTLIVNTMTGSWYEPRSGMRGSLPEPIQPPSTKPAIPSSLSAPYTTSVQYSEKKIRVPQPADNEVVLRSPLAGTVSRIFVTPGDVVEKGKPLVLVTAMKMENICSAPATGTVATIECNIGDAVNRSSILLSLIPTPL